MAQWTSIPARMVRGILRAVIEGGSQFLSLLTFGWWNPFRDPPVYAFLSTSSRAGRGQEEGLWIWERITPLINKVFEHPLLDGEDDHCANSWAGYQRNRGTGKHGTIGAIYMTVIVLVFAVSLWFGEGG